MSSHGSPSRPARFSEGTRPEFVSALAEQLLGSTLDMETRLGVIAGAALGTIADSLTVFLYDYDGAAQVRAVRHRDPSLEVAIAELSEVYRPDPEAGPGSPVPGALAGEERSVDWRETAPSDETTTHAVERLRSTAWLAIPLREVGGRVLGALRFSRGRNEAAFTDQETDIARHLAEVCGSALGHSRSSHEDRRAVARLSRDLAPKPLPTIPGLQLEARYHSGISQVGIGGDWYEVLPVDDRVVIAIGDAAGHGMEAAVSMKEIASAMRAFAFVETAAGVVRRLDRYVSTLRRHGLVTACVLALDLDSLKVKVANAGHVPPIIVSKKGTKAIQRGRTAPLGSGSVRKRFRSGRFKMRHSDRLFLYTDGLVERRGETIDDGIDRLVSAVEGASRDLAKACDEILEVMEPPGGFTDDVAILGFELLREASSRFKVSAHEARWAADEDATGGSGVGPRQQPPTLGGNPTLR